MFTKQCLYRIIYWQCQLQSLAEYRCLFIKDQLDDLSQTNGTTRFLYQKKKNLARFSYLSKSDDFQQWSSVEAKWHDDRRPIRCLLLIARVWYSCLLPHTVVAAAADYRPAPFWPPNLFRLCRTLLYHPTHAHTEHTPPHRARTPERRRSSREPRNKILTPFGCHTHETQQSTRI